MRVDMHVDMCVGMHTDMYMEMGVAMCMVVSPSEPEARGRGPLHELKGRDTRQSCELHRHVRLACLQADLRAEISMISV